MKRKKQSMIFMLTILLVCVALVASIVSVRINIDKKNQEINELNAKIQEKTDSNAALKDSVENSDIEDHAAKIAREQLNYGQSDEKVYVNITGK